jgi:exopolysaccharide production protein ExoZ
VRRSLSLSRALEILLGETQSREAQSDSPESKHSLLIESTNMKGTHFGLATKGRTDASQGKLKTIECFRGIAALSVLLFHSEDTVGRAKYFGIDSLGGFFIFGANGVDFFFVLSGFIITFAHWTDLGRPDRINLYVGKRFARIYPTLWAVTIPFIFVSYAANSGSAPPHLNDRIVAALSSLSLVPSSLLPLPVVVWTLRHEVFFYTLFVSLLVKPILGAILLAIWGSVCLLYFVTTPPDSFPMGFLFSPYNLEFLVGILCACFAKHFRIPLPHLVLTLGIVLFIYAAIVSDNTVQPSSHPTWLVANPNRQLIALFSCASALMIIGASRLDMENMLDPPKYLVMMGAASYSIYLVHVPVVSATCKILKAFNSSVPIAPFLAFLVVALVALTAGILFHLYVEKPLTSAVNRRLIGMRIL